MRQIRLHLHQHGYGNGLYFPFPGGERMFEWHFFPEFCWLKHSVQLGSALFPSRSSSSSTAAKRDHFSVQSRFNHQQMHRDWVQLQLIWILLLLLTKPGRDWLSDGWCLCGWWIRWRERISRWGMEGVESVSTTKRDEFTVFSVNGGILPEEITIQCVLLNVWDRIPCWRWVQC